MARKEIDFGTAQGSDTGDSIAWRGILDDDHLGKGDTTTFHVELTRPLAEGVLADPGATVWIDLNDSSAACVRCDPPDKDTGNPLAAGETKSIDFLITNPPAGDGPADYQLRANISWDTNLPMSSPWVPVP